MNMQSGSLKAEGLGDGGRDSPFAIPKLRLRLPPITSYVCKGVPSDE
jgi:hypothetical protein